MTIDKSGQWWTGTERKDLAEYLQAFRAGGHDVGPVVFVEGCGACGTDSGYRVRVDDEEGYADRACAGCDATHLILDSADFADDATPEETACPCGGELFDVAVGFALRTDGDVRWVSVGLRCRTDGVLGCFGDWKIDYSPADGLMANV